MTDEQYTRAVICALHTTKRETDRIHAKPKIRWRSFTGLLQPEIFRFDARAQFHPTDISRSVGRNSQPELVDQLTENRRSVESRRGA